MGIILIIIFIAIAAALGSSKGYSGVLCGVAGCFGGLIAIIVIALLPNRVEEQEEAARRQSAQNAEITALKNRIRDLEAMQNAQTAHTTEEPACEANNSEI